DLYNHTFKQDGLKVLVEPPDDGNKEEPLIVRALENSLGQVVRNLIDNALTFSPKGEAASVRLKAVRGDGENEGQAIITVDDDGPGIPPDQLEKIFNRFYTQRPQGSAFGDHSGLGLAICRQIMTAHGGTIMAHNRKDADGQVIGARFTVTLPIHKPRKRK
ncbi:MAG TPA: HAMP domain-containing histidine kinase, partial [Hellea balneolensis]|nr:HAMP domain-containing histidine kinase [Hellea balneolensis]